MLISWLIVWWLNWMNNYDYLVDRLFVCKELFVLKIMKICSDTLTVKTHHGINSSSVFVLFSSSSWQQNSEQRSSIVRRTTLKKVSSYLTLREYSIGQYEYFYSKLSNWISDWGGGWCIWYWYVCCALGKPLTPPVSLWLTCQENHPSKGWTIVSDEKERQEWDGLV